MKIRLPLKNKRTGEPQMRLRSCWTYECSMCGLRRVRLHLAALAGYIGGLAQVFMIWLDASDATRRRFNDRARERGLATVRIQSGHVVLLIANADLGTRADTSGSMVSPREAMGAARQIMAIPPNGALRVDGSRRWPMPNKAGGSSDAFQVFMDMTAEPTWLKGRAVVRDAHLSAGGAWPERDDLPGKPAPWTYDELIHRIVAACSRPAEVGSQEQIPTSAGSAADIPTSAGSPP